MKSLNKTCLQFISQIYQFYIDVNSISTLILYMREKVILIIIFMARVPHIIIIIHITQL